MNKVISSFLTLTISTSMFLGASPIKEANLLNAGARIEVPTSPVFENLTEEELELVAVMKEAVEVEVSEEETIKVRVELDEESEDAIHEKDIYIVMGEPLEYHHVYEIDPFNNLLSIEDGSVWKTISSEMGDVFDWHVSDSIVIEQNASLFDLLFTGYPYIMKNLNLIHIDGHYDYIHADLKAQPWAFDEDAYWVYDMSSFWGDITLCDGTQWVTYDSISSWSINDHIVIGRNANSSTRVSYPYILINTRLNTYARAKLR